MWSQNRSIPQVSSHGLTIVIALTVSSSSRCVKLQNVFHVNLDVKVLSEIQILDIVPSGNTRLVAASLMPAFSKSWAGLLP